MHIHINLYVYVSALHFFRANLALLKALQPIKKQWLPSRAYTHPAANSLTGIVSNTNCKAFKLALACMALNIQMGASCGGGCG